MAPVADVDAPAKASPLFARYGTRVDAQSAREILAGRLEAAREPGAAARPRPSRLEHIPAPKLPKAPRRAPAPDPGGIGDFLNSRQGKAMQREVMRGVFGMLKKRAVSSPSRTSRRSGLISAPTAPAGRRKARVGGVVRRTAAAAQQPRTVTLPRLAVRNQIGVPTASVTWPSCTRRP